MPTFNGWNIIAMPASPAPQSIEFTANDVVAMSVSPFTGQQQTMDWQAGWLEASVIMPPMPEQQAKAWTAFLLALRGQANVFQLGVPPPSCYTAPSVGTPVVNGANQTGFSLATRGWTASLSPALKAGEWLQVGNRMYQNLADAAADGSGHSTLSIWPKLRESPPDATALILTTPKAFWRLKGNARKWSITEIRMYGMQFDILEAL